MKSVNWESYALGSLTLLNHRDVISMTKWSNIDTFITYFVGYSKHYQELKCLFFLFATGASCNVW